MEYVHHAPVDGQTQKELTATHKGGGAPKA